MKKFINSKILLVGIAAVFAFVSAQNSASVKFVGQAKVEDVGSLDTLDITFKTVVKNITAEIGFTKSTNSSESPIKFDYATLTVADLFNGILTVKAFDIGYQAGENQVIRPELDPRGLKFIIKPIDMLLIGVGYGIGSRDFPSAASGLLTYRNRDYHAIQLDLGISNSYVPTTIYSGMVIINGDGILQGTSDTSPLESVKVFHFSAGFSADLLAMVMAGVLKLDLGMVFPIAGAATASSFENEFNLAAILYGSADIVAGFGMGYAVTFALDTESKIATFGDLDGDADSDNFVEMLKFSVTPVYSISQFKIALNAILGVVGPKTSSIAAGRARKNLYTTADGYIKFEMTPSVTWSPGGGNSVKLYFTYDQGRSDEGDDATTKTLGVDVSMTISVENR